MEGIIKVSPQVLINTASEFGNQASLISNITSEMVSMITGLSSAWEGEAAVTYINKFKGLEDDIQKMVRMVQEHSTDLEQMARVYMEAEKQSQDMASTLSSDVII